MHLSMLNDDGGNSSASQPHLSHAASLRSAEDHPGIPHRRKKSEQASRPHPTSIVCLCFPAYSCFCRKKKKHRNPAPNKTKPPLLEYAIQPVATLTLIECPSSPDIHSLHVPGVLSVGSSRLQDRMFPGNSSMHRYGINICNCLCTLAFPSNEVSG